MEKIIYISGLISASITRELTGEEMKNLQKWLNEDERHIDIYNGLRKEEYLKSKVDYYSNVDVVKAYSRINEKIDKRRKHRRLFSLLKYAAVILFPVVISTLIVLYFPQNNQLVNNEQTVIEAGNSKAYLILGNGNSIDVSDIDSDTTLIENGVNIYSSNRKLTYSASTYNFNAEEYNSLVVPRGGEYFLELSDGTKVWMNSESKLKYPVKFIGGKRKVYLEGEAYFKVAHNSKKPFVIDVNGSEVKVLGTSFNLRAYNNEPEVIATLVNGSISLSTTKDTKTTSVILNPGEQGKIYSSGEVSKKKVDVKLFTSWKDGRIIFKNQTLGDLMNVIYRWYDIEVFYMNPDLKNVEYTGNIKRYSDFNDVIELLEMAGLVEFEIKGRTVTIKEK